MSNGLWIQPEDLPNNLENSEFALEACEAASFLLWGMSGRKFSGVYNVTERYTLSERNFEERFYLSPSVGYAIPSSVFVIIAADIQHNAIRLKGTPANSITSMHLVTTGDLVDPALYDLWNHSVIRFKGSIPGDVDISYSYGAGPPAAGRMAALHLATQFAYLWSGQEDMCSLPTRVTNVTRQNVSWTLLDPQDFIDDLRTGIYAVDLFLKTVNPDKARNRAKVFSPDIPRGRRKTLSS